jgi:hypothetical protein
MTDTTTNTSPPPSSAGERASEVASTAADEATTVASGAKEQAASVASAAKEQAKEVGSQAADEAKDLLADARQQLRAQADEQAHRLAGTVGSLGSQLRTTADSGEPGTARDVVRQLADQANTFSSKLDQGGLDRTLNDVKRMARNRPGMFLLGAAAAGFVAARVARNADTQALADAAKSTNGNGSAQVGTTGSFGTSGALGGRPDLSSEAPRPSELATSMPAQSPPPRTEPLRAQPPTTEPPR